MRAALQVAYGDLDTALQITEVPTPRPGPGQVLIKVRTATLNRKDLFAFREPPKGGPGPGLRRRPPLPHVNGADCIGEIAALGEGVTGWAEGDWVTPYSGLFCGHCEYCEIGEHSACLSFGNLGEQTWGGFAEYVLAPARNLVAIPPGTDLDEAVCAGGAWATAWRGLVTVAQAQPGETVLIVGASGGVGCGAIRIAKLAGCRVIAVQGGEWKGQRALELGADHAIDYTREDFEQRTKEITGGRGADVVMDTVGAETWRKSINSMARLGRMTICAATTGDNPDISIREIYQFHRRILGAPLGNMADFRALCRAVFSGQLAPIVHARLPLTRIHDGLRMLQARNFFGKVVIYSGRDA